MIAQKIVNIRDAWGRPAYTGRFLQTFYKPPGFGVWLLIRSDRVPT